MLLPLGSLLQTYRGTFGTLRHQPRRSLLGDDAQHLLSQCRPLCFMEPFIVHEFPEHSCSLNVLGRWRFEPLSLTRHDYYKGHSHLSSTVLGTSCQAFTDCLYERFLEARATAKLRQEKLAHLRQSDMHSNCFFQVTYIMRSDCHRLDADHRAI